MTQEKNKPNSAENSSAEIIAEIRGKYNSLTEKVANELKVPLALEFSKKAEKAKKNRYPIRVSEDTKMPESSFVFIKASDFSDAIYVSERTNEVPTLDECLRKIREKHPMSEEAIITVICVEALRGAVYKYGNSGEYWEKVRSFTEGYAN